MRCRRAGIAGRGGDGTNRPLRLWSPRGDGDVDPAAVDDSEASMGNNTSILTTLDGAWASPGSVIDLFVDSFRHGVRTSSLLRHLVIITFDGRAGRLTHNIARYLDMMGKSGFLAASS
ncbi:hypothetical protein GUJ93_ZPchr0006g42256 [Zizania palustris]|uniref:Uncharacterized protein n=1 Tax=Zizania palustris TaxID=103762 RepID=A0A8J5T0F4_ZIZPA|nr:hypothetical protein GUJ93_ZPchr0006g42256 [Zizania palustris]